MNGSSNTRIRTMDMPILDEVFVMGQGLVLNFSNQTFADFFREELQVDIDHPRWEAQGGSKARRLRYYLRQADRRTALDTLNALWAYREISGVTHDYPKLDDTVRDAFFKILERLGAKMQSQAGSTTTPSQRSIDADTASSLSDHLLQVSKLEPQPRGPAFEKFLNDMFNVYGLSARASFRLGMRPGAAASMARRISKASGERCRSRAMLATTGSAGRIGAAER